MSKLKIGIVSKETVFLICFLGLSFMVNAQQTIVDREEVSCNGIRGRTHEVLDSNKVLVICMLGLDCPGCNANAPTLVAYGNSNKQKLTMWFAMSFMSGGGQCQDIEKWDSLYNLSSLFAFADSTKYWERNYVGAEFLVIEPRGKTIVYRGYNLNLALDKADEQMYLLSSEDYDLEYEISVFPNPSLNNVTVLYSLPDFSEGCILEIVNSTGQTILESKVNSQHSLFQIESKLPSGVYFAIFKFNSNQRIYSKPFIIKTI